VKRELTPVFVEQEPDTHCTQHSLHYTADPATVKTSNKYNNKQMASNLADFMLTQFFKTNIRQIPASILSHFHST